MAQYTATDSQLDDLLDCARRGERSQCCLDALSAGDAASHDDVPDNADALSWQRGVIHATQKIHAALKVGRDE